MWKVQRTNDGDRAVLLVSGRLEGEHLAELRGLFTSEVGDGKLILDLREARLVDQDSIAFLSQCEASGAQIRNCPAYIREWIEREKEDATFVSESPASELT